MTAHYPGRGLADPRGHVPQQDLQSWDVRNSAHGVCVRVRTRIDGVVLWVRSLVPMQAHVGNSRNKRMPKLEGAV